jgi:hypothetical protein
VLGFPIEFLVFNKLKHKVSNRFDPGLLQSEFVQPNCAAQAVNYRKPFAHFISEGPSFIAVRRVKVPSWSYYQTGVDFVTEAGNIEWSPRLGAIGQ